MSVLTAILTHLPAADVRAQLEYLAGVCPASRFVVLHGGSSEHFAPLAGEAHAAFVTDPTLRGPHFEKSLNGTLELLHGRFVAGDPGIELVFVIEYDHLLLRADFETPLRELAAAHPAAGLFGKHASPRNDTNWSHFLAARGDRELDAFIERISVRGDATARFGCLGTGLLLRRAALEAFASLAGKPERYVELFVPTVIHHLGYEVIDVDARGDLFAGVRWLPPFSVPEVLARARGGAYWVHPFKEVTELSSIATAVGTGRNSSVPASRP